MELERERQHLIVVNQEQAEAFIHRNKDLEYANASLRQEVDSLQRASADLEEQVEHPIS